MTSKSVVQIRLTARDGCMFDEALPPAARVTYYALDFHARWKGECFPSQERLSSEIGLSLRELQRALKALRDAGYLSLDRKRRETAVYRLAWSADQDPPQVADQEFKTRQNSIQDPPNTADQVLIVEAGLETGATRGNPSNQTQTPERQTGLSLDVCKSCKGSGRVMIEAIGWSACAPCRGSGRSVRRSA